MIKFQQKMKKQHSYVSDIQIKRKPEQFPENAFISIFVRLYYQIFSHI